MHLLCLVVLHLLEFSVVGPPTSRVDQAPSDTRNQKLVIDLELDHRVQFLLTVRKHPV